jgi:hypothetical protein
MKKYIASLLLVFTTVAYAAATRTIDVDTMKSSDHTKVWTPPAATDTLVGRASTDTLTNKTIDGDNNTVQDLPGASVFKTNAGLADTFFSYNSSGVPINTKAVPAGTIVDDTTVQTLSNKKVVDGNFSVVDIGDNTKTMKFDAAGTTGTSTTLLGTQTADRILSLPNATDTLVGKATTDTLTNKTFDADGTGNSITNIENADIKAAAGIVDTKLATISTAGKVSNSATTATSANTNSAIVARDGSGNFSAGTITASLTGNATNVTGTVAVANGGTGQTTYTDGQLLIGNTTGNTLAKSTLTAGTGVTITNGSGTITIAAAGTTSLSYATCTNTCTASADVTYLDGTSNAFTVTVPTPVGVGGKVYRFIRIDNTLANLITITPAAGTIAGAASVHAATKNEKWELVSDNTIYQINGHLSNLDWFTCTPAGLPTSSGSAIFTITAATVTGGDVYSNNGAQFTVSIGSVSTTMTTAASGAPAASGTLTKVSGSGPATITFSAVTNARPARGSNTIVTDTVTCARRGRKILIHRLYRQSATSGATAGTGDWVEFTPAGVVLDTSATTGCNLYANTTAANSYLEDMPNSALAPGNDCIAVGILTSAAAYQNAQLAMPMGPNVYRISGFQNFATINYPFTIGQVNYTTAAWTWNVSAQLYVLNWED